MKTIIDASGVSPDVLVWLKKGRNGFCVERMRNRQGAAIDRFPVPDAFAEKLQAMTTEQAWFAMERFVGAGE